MLRLAPWLAGEKKPKVLICLDTEIKNSPDAELAGQFAFRLTLGGAGDGERLVTVLIFTVLEKGQDGAAEPRLPLKCHFLARCSVTPRLL